MAGVTDVSVATQIRTKVASSRDRFWRPEDFDGSPLAVAKALSRLAHAGELRRVRRGLYWRGTTTPFGMAPPPSDRFVHEVIGTPGTGPASWSASLALGLSTQVPRRETIAVPGRSPLNPGTVRFVSRAASAKRRDERLRPTEVALFEVLREWNTLVEVPTDEAVERIASLAESGVLRLDRLVRASTTEPPRVRERLRRLLHALDRATDAARVRPARGGSALHDLAFGG